MESRLVKNIVLLLIIFGTQKHINACSCHHTYVEHFCDIVDEDHYIIRAVVIDNPDDPYIDAFRQIVVTNNLNKSITKDTIVLHGSNALNCGEYLNRFLLGDTLILALEDYGQDVYYLEGSCGVHYLRYSKGRVFDRLYPSTDTMDYQVFVDELLQCMDFSTSINEPEKSSPPVRFYPNPFTHEITIESSVEIGEGSVVSIFSIAGQLHRQEKLGVGIKKTLSVEGLPQGVYLLKLQMEDGYQETLKVVKE